MIDYRTLKSWPFPDIEHAYTADDAVRYALAVGLGADPMDERQLAFVDETLPGTPRVVPTLAVVLGFPGSWMRDPGTGIDFSMIVHGEELVQRHAPLPPEGVVVARHRVTRIVDKGAGRGATVTYDKELTDRASGQRLATVTHTTFCRGDGGFSAVTGETDAAPAPPAAVPNRAPDQVLELATLAQQALLYRLCADRNPLHSQPAVARKAGFERPILHGLGTYGFACHALLAGCCDYEPTRLRSLFARFAAPVLPGDTLRFELWRDADEIAFRARAKERDRTVLDFGRAQIGPARS